jgi:hypothetical protein
MDWRQLRAIYFCAVAQVDPRDPGTRLELGPPARAFLEQLVLERGAAYGLEPGAGLDGRKLAELVGLEGEAFRGALLARAEPRAPSAVEARAAWVRERAAHNLAARRAGLCRLATRLPPGDPIQPALAAEDAALAADVAGLAAQPIADVARTLAHHHATLGALELRVDLACDRDGLEPAPRNHGGAALGDLIQIAEIVAAVAREDDAIASARHPYTRWLVRRAAERPSESLRADMTLRQHERSPPELERVLAAMADTAEGHAILVARPPVPIAVQAFHGMLADTVGTPAAAAMLRRVLRRARASRASDPRVRSAR